MPNLIDILLEVHENVHDLKKLKPKKKYSGPTIYTGGVKILQWNSLSKTEQSKALSKDWYLYYSYRNPASDKLERQANIKAGANYYKTKKERIEILETLSRNLERLLNEGYSPFENNIFNTDEIMTVKQAFDYALDLKKETISDNTYPRFKNRIDRFKGFLINNGFLNRYITSVDKKTVLTYLNRVLKNTSARTRNNTRSDISSLFGLLAKNDIIPENFVLKIDVLKADPVRNKTFTEEQVEEIFDYLSKTDINLLLFIKFVSYNFLRPIEVCRLEVANIDLKEKILTVKTKDGKTKRKLIPEILYSKIGYLEQYNSNDYIFTLLGHPGKWETRLNNRRDYFTKRFLKIKIHFELGEEYSIYSFRHYHITKLYRELRKKYSPFETKSRLMLITGHSTMKALENYLRDIDAELPEDYSDLLKK